MTSQSSPARNPARVSAFLSRAGPISGGGVVAVVLLLAVVGGCGILIHRGADGSANATVLKQWLTATRRSDPSFLRQGSDVSGVIAFIRKPSSVTSIRFQRGCSDLATVIADRPASPPVRSVARRFAALERSVGALRRDCRRLIAHESTQGNVHVLPYIDALVVDVGRLQSSARALLQVTRAEISITGPELSSLGL